MTNLSEITDTSVISLHHLSIEDSGEFTWAGYVACMVNMIMLTNFWSVDLNGKENLGILGVDVLIILKWISSTV
jgi:hypothetical protein